MPYIYNPFTGNFDYYATTTPVIVAVISTTKTLAASDANSIQACSNASAQTITIPLNSSVAFSLGTLISFEADGVGLVTIQAAAGVILNGVNGGSVSLGAQFTGGYIRQDTTTLNTWYFLAVGGPLTIASSSANALAVGANGLTSPAFNVDASTASSATGINIKSAAAGAGIALSVTSSGTNDSLTINAKGTGQITLGGTSTGTVGVGSGATFALYNTADTVTNFERLEIGLFTTNIFGIRANKGGSGSSRNIVIYFPAGTAQAINIPAASNLGITVLNAAQTTMLANGQWAFAAATANTSTTGTGSVVNISPSFSPSATSTAIMRCLDIAPTINFSNATPGSGNYEALRIRAIETALPTGTNYLIRLSAGAAGTTDKFLVDNAGNITMADAATLAFGTTTGTKIGTASTQKIGFWNVTPVVQQVLATGALHTTDDVISFLQTIGLCKQS